MIRRNNKNKVVTFMLGILLGISTMVYATTALSPYGYYGPHQDYYYKNRAYVGTDPAIAGTEVFHDGSGNVPIGYMGAQARLFKNDVLYKSNTMWYNDTELWGFSRTTSTTTSSGTYYSKGITAAYNGDGYTNYYTFQSPSLNQ